MILNSRNTRDEKLMFAVMAGLMAALVAVGSALRITLPVNVGTTSFHLGNIMCALSGIFLGPVGGGLAAGIGSAIYDMTNPLYISECWITFLTKGAYGVAAGLVAWSGGRRGGRRFSLASPWSGHRRGERYGWNLAGTVAGAAVYAVLYLFKGFAWDGLLLGGLQTGPALAALVPKLPATAFNAVIAVVCAPALAAAVQKARHTVGSARG